MLITCSSHLCLQVSATDADSPVNSAVSFSLLDYLGGRFRIDNTTGTVYARGFFDAESGTTEYTLTVVATDSGNTYLLIRSSIHTSSNYVLSHVTIGTRSVIVRKLLHVTVHMLTLLLCGSLTDFCTPTVSLP